MEELKKFELNNKVLEDFDKLMSYHLDQVEELNINEIFIDTKLYNIISLCTNLKILVINGDLRVDVNKIFFNICKPEKIETIILNGVKLPTTKSFIKFTNIQTISLNNIIFCDVNGFFHKIVNKEKIIALNLTNVDLGKKPISICSKFPNLKYFNIDGIKNCIFDNFDFIFENKKIERFEFYNNEISFENVKSLCKGKYLKCIDVNIETSNQCEISNSFEVNSEGEISLTINTSDIQKMIDNIGLYKIDNLLIILENDIEISDYIRTLKKVKSKVIIAIKDISFLDIETVNKLRDRLNVEFITVLDYNFEKDNHLKYYYSIDDYIEIRKNFDIIINQISNNYSEMDKFNELYFYLEHEIDYDENAKDIKNVLVLKKSSQNLYATVCNSCLLALNLNGKVIVGEAYQEENRKWNQVKIDDVWYNFDLGSVVKAKHEKKILQYMFKGNLFDDNQFYKSHVPLYGNPEKCFTEIINDKKEIKNNLKKIGFISKIYYKLKSIFISNKNIALLSPENDDKK